MPNNPLLKQLSEYEEGPRFIHLAPAVENEVEILSRPTDAGTHHPTIFEVMVRFKAYVDNELMEGEGKWSVSSKRLAKELVTHLGVDDAKWPGSKVAVAQQGEGFERTWTVRRLGK